MRVAFAGTPDFAATILKGLISSDHEVGLVISQPDARRGRGRNTTPTPVARTATEYSLQLTQPDRIVEATGQISAYDILVVAAYGQILPSNTLQAAKYGAWNVHASLLPQYRGAAPVERAIMAGETTTGVTIIEMDEGLDTGRVAKKRKLSIASNENGGEIRRKLADIGSKAMVEVLSLLETGGLELTVQEDSEATYAAKISGNERVLDWRKERIEICNFIRALAPYVGARTSHPSVDGPIKIWAARIPEFRAPELSAGEIFLDKGQILVGCGDGALCIGRIQLPGGRPLEIDEFLRGNSLEGSFTT